ncbi:uncharacterized protein LOC121534820 [Coregonus clupeaformis]|uniref:uncharacterized protein LOC121534820 n=1 Tax=Coregonus clupeaformis TaxID=59861 RepID=UPI001E1C322F|nr:uncharacterized protein LOC121534820 [Coregonus clupeaformis]
MVVGEASPRSWTEVDSWPPDRISSLSWTEVDSWPPDRISSQSWTEVDSWPPDRISTQSWTGVQLAYRGSHGNDITPTTDKVFGLEGDVIKLSCNYSSASNLQWYRQYPGSSPIFLLLTGVTSNPSVVNAYNLSYNMMVLYTVILLSALTGVSCDDLTPLKKEFCLEGTPVTLSYNYSRTATGDSFQQTIQPNQHEVYGEEGSNVQLSCNYSSAYSVLWYKQYPGSAPQFLLFIHHASRTVVRAKPPYPHLTVKLNKDKNCVDLEISSVEVRDSALYYSDGAFLHILPSTMLFCSLLLFFDLIGLSSEQVLTPYTDVEVASERDRVSLSCNYTSSGDNLLWYRQHPKSAPQLVVMEYVDYTPGFTLNHDKKAKRVDLEISSAEVTDSALYYCALRPTIAKVKSLLTSRVDMLLPLRDDW